jgi:hypothetical protein
VPLPHPGVPNKSSNTSEIILFHQKTQWGRNGETGLSGSQPARDTIRLDPHGA